MGREDLATIVRRRSGGRCECCGVPHGETVIRRDRDDAWFDAALGQWRHAGDGRPIGDAAHPKTNPHYLESVGEARAFAIELFIAVVKRPPAIVAEDNVQDLCGVCRARICHPDTTREQRKAEERRRRAVGDLFEEVKR